MLFLHTNTVKYRLQRISDLLGCRLGKMPETIELYRSAAIYRLLHEPRRIAAISRASRIVLKDNA